MPSYLANTCIVVFPFTQQPDGEEVIIANATQSAFLSVPSSAVDILLWLAERKTIGEAQSLYEQKYGEYPDIDDFLDLLESENFISSQAAAEPAHRLALNTSPDLSANLAHGSLTRARYHFTGISENAARLAFSPPVLIVCFLLIGIAMAMLVAQPSLFPSPGVLVFKQHTLLLVFSVIVFVFFTVFLHEMAHLVAARAISVPARLGLSNRLWILVAETDVTGIWMAPRRKRYLVLLAGPLFDAVSASLFVFLVFSQRHGWLSLSPSLNTFCQAALFTYLPRLLWQCYFFVRTDFYYVFVTLFNCKNLMQDTERFLVNQITRFIPISHRHDLSRIPAHEMSIIRLYSLLWIAGRLVALCTLFFLSLPILWGYSVNIFHGLAGRSPLDHLSPLDLVGWIVIALITMAIQVSGLLLWLRSLFSKIEVK